MNPAGYPGGAGPAGYPLGPGVSYGIPVAEPMYGIPAATAVPIAPLPPAAPPSVISPPSYDSKAKDTWATIAFWVHVAVILLLAFALGVPATKADSGAPVDDPTRPASDLNTVLFLRVIAIALVAAAGVSYAGFHILRRFGGGLIKVSLYASAGILIFSSFALCAVNFIAGLFMLLVCAGALYFIYAARRRIPFAAAHLQLACDATAAFPGVYTVALVALVVQALWVITWSAAALGVEHAIGVPKGSTKNGGHGNSGGTAVLFLMLVSLFWGSTVVANVVHSVTASTVGYWWYVPASQVSSPVKSSLRRAMTSGFGPIAMGSLLISVLHALEVTARAAEHQARREGHRAAAFAAECMLCVLRCARGLAETFSHWGLVFCALTGESLAEGGRHVMELFGSRAWTLIINEDLVNMALRIVNLGTAFLSALVAAGATMLMMPTSSQRSDVAVIAAAIAFVAGGLSSSVMTSVLTSAVRTVFVCFAMAPTALQLTHPQHLELLATAWATAHPDAWAACGYGSMFTAVAITALPTV